jgi:hypothetical protein
MEEPMERYRLEFQDGVFFERFRELSDQQIRYYLGLRQAYRRLSADPQERQQVAESVRAGEGKIGIEEVDLVMDFELLCEKGFIWRARSGAT